MRAPARFYRATRRASSREEVMSMRFVFVLHAALLICVLALRAQEAPSSPTQQQDETSNSRKDPAQNQGATTSVAPTVPQPPGAPPTDSPDGQQNPSQEELQKIILEHWKQLPDSPQPKSADKENSMCPAGVGNSCALLGGWVYYPDLIGLSYHEKTWWDAMKSPGMLTATFLLLAATALDVEGSQACIDKHTCRELNPLMRGPKAQKYAISMSVNSAFIWMAVREKQHGRGVFAFGTMWAMSVVHSYFGVGGLYQARTR
jgi:hypothetical protein